MFHSKNRRHFARVLLLLISLIVVWLTISTAVIIMMFETAGTGCICNPNKQPNPLERRQHWESLKETIQPENTGLKNYSEGELHRWRPARPVRENKNSPGEWGTAVQTSPEDKDDVSKLYKVNHFNLFVSDMIALNRSLKDVRSEACKSQKLPKYLPDTSIVIVFRNEAWSTLLRTVWSAINRSPRILLKEIILVDDHSEHEHLKQKLEDYVKTLPVPTYVFRTGTRVGLTRARLLGAKQVTGQVITFLDAHCECTEGWLEPLLARIAENRRTVVVPIVGTINQDTFAFLEGDDSQWGGFSWQIEHFWFLVPQREKDRRKGDPTAPLRTPTMIGGLFSIDRDYFYESGAYDEGLKIWGSENMEMSFRIWQCGGVLEMVPCSHVGHVFRRKSPHTFPGGSSEIIRNNAARVAEVWMDEWKHIYFALTPDARNISMENISERVKLRKDLKCKSFAWYLENIFPEAPVPINLNYFGSLKNMETHTCLDTMQRPSGENVGLYPCHNISQSQTFMYTRRKELLINNSCLDAVGLNYPVKLLGCHGLGGNQAWSYDKDIKMIMHTSSNHCLSTARSDGLKEPTLVKCDPNDAGQKWTMQQHIKAESQKIDFPNSL